jgi:RNA polymerase sigma-70 factor (ECF subfamily)
MPKNPFLLAKINKLCYDKAMVKIDEIQERLREALKYTPLSQKEIAATLRLSPENVRILSYRGKKELRKFLEENGYDIS